MVNDRIRVRMKVNMKTSVHKYEESPFLMHHHSPLARTGGANTSHSSISLSFLCVSGPLNS